MTIPAAETALRAALVDLRATERTFAVMPANKTIARELGERRTAVHLARRALRKAHEAARVDVLPEMGPLHAAIAEQARVRAQGGDPERVTAQRAFAERVTWERRGWTLKRGKWIAPKRARNGDAK